MDSRAPGNAPRIQVSTLEFKTDLTPYSPTFQDVYFAPNSGIEESRYIYLEGSGFLEALKKGTSRITLAEMGFGVGLNFLLTLKAFKAVALSTQSLHYISFEKFPIVLQDLKKLYSQYPEVKEEAEELFTQYPLLIPGIHRIQFQGGRVTLDLVLGDALTMLPETSFYADHWYWDGFAPRTNQDAFSETFFREVALHSKRGAQGASFTSATWVRKNLEQVHFQVEKRKGFGQKRECIMAIFKGEEKPLAIEPWFHHEAFPFRSPPERSKGKVAVIGAGFAGSAIARAAADYGFEVQVFDRNGIASRASGNSVGLFNVQLSLVPSPMSRFSALALAHFLREVERLKLSTHRGILRRGDDIANCLKNSDYPTAFFEERGEEVFFPECGMIHPEDLCKKRLEHERISVHKKGVIRVERDQSKFTLHFENGESTKDFHHVIYALGADQKLPVHSLEHKLLEDFPSRPIRGQTIQVKPTDKSRGMKSIYVDEGYISPLDEKLAHHGNHLIGATYQAKAILPDQEQLDTEKLLNEAKLKWKEFEDHTLDSVVSLKSGYRLSTPDKLPLIGPLCSEEKLKLAYQHALRGARISDLPPLPIEPGEWLLTGMGSRGITFSSLSAEILLSLMTHQPLPIELDLLPHLHSSRFFIRNLRKSEVKS